MKRARTWFCVCLCPSAVPHAECPRHPTTPRRTFGAHRPRFSLLPASHQGLYGFVLIRTRLAPMLRPFYYRRRSKAALAELQTCGKCHELVVPLVFTYMAVVLLLIMPTHTGGTRTRCPQCPALLRWRIGMRAPQLDFAQPATWPSSLQSLNRLPYKPPSGRLACCCGRWSPGRGPLGSSTKVGLQALLGYVGVQK